MPDLTIVPYAEHQDHDYIKRARTCAMIEHEGKTFQLRARRGVKGFFLFFNRGDRSFSTKGFFPCSEEALSHVAEFAKALGLSTAILIPMWEIAKVIFP